MRIQHVFQRGDSDCGVACLAMITGMSYEEAFAAIGCDEEEEHFYTTHGDLTNILKALGWNIRWKKFRSWDAIPGYAIVAVNHRCNRRYFHWVVFDGEKIFDPIPQSQQEDSRYLASGWYLLVMNGEITPKSERNRS